MNLRILTLLGMLSTSFIISTASAQGVLEIPQPGSFQSGIGLVSGWHCGADVVEIRIDDVRFIPVAYGTERGDTRTVCGDTDNGFSFLINYNALGLGTHTITAHADRVQFGSSTFSIQTFGQEFLTGVSGEYDLPDFPSTGQTARIRWQEANQNFVVTGCQGCSTGTIPCGDGVCSSDETPSSCPADCGTPSQTCGDGHCSILETAQTCPKDCGSCGDGICGGHNESVTSCGSDCDPDFCPPGEICLGIFIPHHCGDGQCNIDTVGEETNASCPRDCGSCGDGICSINETPDSCPNDCIFHDDP